jgi:pyrroloquinoline quinone biosynthesis protein E
MPAGVVPAFPPPMGLIAELTHRCPLQCPYCSNPLALDPVRDELPPEIWLRVIDEAAAMGVLQIHFTGGEPMARRDLPGLVHRAAKGGIYTNIITSGVTLDDRAMEALRQAGIDHIQLSFQDIDPKENDRIGGYEGGFVKKRAADAEFRYPSP